MTDYEAFDKYPNDNHWYDKLFVAHTFGVRAGVETIPEDGRYVIRPIINLDGCGLGAQIRQCTKGEKIDPTMFWSEVFFGPHVTIDYTRINGKWVQGHTFEGLNTPTNLMQFSAWFLTDYQYILPEELTSVESDHINLELIGGRIIEVHLRHNTDPVEHDIFIPIWSEEQPHPGITWERIADREDHPGRLGFYVPKKDQ